MSPQVAVLKLVQVLRKELNADIMIINSSSSDEETIFINPDSKYEASSSKTSTDVAYISVVQLILNYPTKYRFFSTWQCLIA